MPFLLIRNDITKVPADVIVNPANTHLREGSGTSRAIYLAAGEAELNAACRAIGGCELGKAVITPGFGLQAKYIIHTVGPRWRDGFFGEEKILYSAYTEALKLAREYGAESIAFPLLSSGNYGYPKEKALKVAVSAISDFLMEHEMLVYMVLYDRKALGVSKKMFLSIEEYIDDHYVEHNDESFPGYRGRNLMATRAEVMPAAPASRELSECMPAAPSPRKLEDLIKNIGETFSQMLLRLIDERSLTDSMVYHRANIDRKHFSKIRNNVNYVPKKKTVMAFAIALELSLDETKDLLQTAGYSFSNSSKFDIIIRYFIENAIYDVFTINEMLFAYEQPVLGE